MKTAPDFVCVCVYGCPHHSSQSDERALDLSVVDILKQIVGLEDVMWLQAVLCDGANKIPYVFQLRKKKQKKKNDLFGKQLPCVIFNFVYLLL